MNWKLAINIALTHLFTKRKQTLVAMMGVMFGISMFITMISFMTGVNQWMEDVAMDGTPHVRIFNPMQVKEERIIDAVYAGSNNWQVVAHQKPGNDLPKIRNAALLAKELEALPEVQGVAPQLATQAFFNNGPIKISGSISGIDVRKQQALFNLQSKVEDGSLDDLLTASNSILLGRGLARKLNAVVGNRVSITTPEGATILLKVVGTFSYGISTFDDTKAFATISTVQKILQKDPSYVTDLHIKLKDYRQSKAFAQKLQPRFSVYAEDWEAANASLLAGDVIRNMMTGIISFTLLLVAGFGIYNIMNMNIMNKMKDIAILKATGFEGGDIVGIFLLQSVIIGIIGGLLGLLLGYGCCCLLRVTPFPAGEFWRMNTLPVNFDGRFYAAGMLFGFVTTLLAGYFPSKRAAKIDPVKIIRG
ncbi:MAG TPA: FtsX-like permease family protein [Flavisolibacter sp.]|jgi:lipoprotein-releasing system permease protein|nr:FtsX-like permease family protein [Flavisolibacter sp.]